MPDSRGCYQGGKGLSNDPDFAVDEEFLWIGNLGRTKRSIRLQELMNPGHGDLAVVVRDKLGASSRLKAVLRAFPVGKRQVHLDFLPKLAYSSTPGVVTGIESLANLL